MRTCVIISEPMTELNYETVQQLQLLYHWHYCTNVGLHNVYQLNRPLSALCAFKSDSSPPSNTETRTRIMSSLHVTSI